MIGRLLKALFAIATNGEKLAATLAEADAVLRAGFKLDEAKLELKRLDDKALPPKTDGARGRRGA